MPERKILTPQFLSVFFSQFTLSFSYNLLVPTLPIYLARLGSREEAIGILIGALSVSSLVLRPIVGNALSKIPEKKFMLAGALLYALTSLAYLVAPPFWPFLIVRIAQGVATACFYTASVLIVINISPENRRGQSLSYYYTAFNFAFAIAPSVGIYTMNLLGFPSLFLFCTALALISLALALRLPMTSLSEKDRVAPQKYPLFDLKTLHPSMMSFFIHILYGSLTAFFPLYAVSRGVGNPGLFFSAFAITLIVGRMFGGRLLDRYPRDHIVLPCATAFIVAMAFLALSKSLAMFILVAVLWGVGNAFLFPALVTYTVERAGEARGPAMGTFTAAGDLGAGIGPIVMGIVLRLTSYPIMFLCLALIAAMNLAYFRHFMREKQGQTP